jgi:hypothetical protein
MEVLKQWVCDVCGHIIETPEKCYVVWKYKGTKEKQFEYKIVHQNHTDEHGKKCGCDNDRSYHCSASMSGFLGDRGMVKLLSMIDPGALHMPEYKEQIKNIRDFLEFFRRVQLPYYEEARLYWGCARNDGYFVGANEVWIYLPSTLKDLIEKYSKRN